MKHSIANLTSSPIGVFFVGRHSPDLIPTHPFGPAIVREYTSSYKIKEGVTLSVKKTIDLIEFTARLIMETGCQVVIVPPEVLASFNPVGHADVLERAVTPDYSYDSVERATNSSRILGFRKFITRLPEVEAAHDYEAQI